MSVSATPRGGARQLRQLIDTIDILETRLSAHPLRPAFLSNLREQEDTMINMTYDQSIFTNEHACLYYTYLGDSYFKLAVLSEKGQHYPEFCNRCILVFEVAERLVQTIPNNMSLRLSCSYGLSKALLLFQNDIAKAKEVASKLFEDICVHTNKLDNKTIATLQKIRDEILALREGDEIGVHKKDEDAESLEFENSPAAAAKAEQDAEAIKRRESKSLRRKSSFLSAALAVGHTLSSKERAAAIFLQSLRQEIYAVPPPVLESLKDEVPTKIPYSVQMVRSNPELQALELIFKAYVQGHSLSAHTATGSIVTMGKHHISLEMFLALGPYLSWDGFSLFLKEFFIALSPKREIELYKARGTKKTIAAASSNHPRSLPSSMLLGSLAARPEYQSGAGGSPGSPGNPGSPVEGGGLDLGHTEWPLPHNAAVALFIECSLSSKHTLVSAKYLKLMETFKSTASWHDSATSLHPALAAGGYGGAVGSETGGSSSRSVSVGNNITALDPWAEALEWMLSDFSRTEDKEASIQLGLNFSQFLDFVGKCALKLYSAPHISGALPTPAAKINHFLSTNLGMGRSDRWRTVVSTRQAKTAANLAAMAMKRVSEGAGEGNTSGNKASGTNAMDESTQSRTRRKIPLEGQTNQLV